MSKVTEIYNDYLKHLNTAKSKRYDGMEQWFHSSSAGLCARKHYYSAVEKVKGKEVDPDTLRLFRLGDVVHTDIQNALQWYASTNGSRILIEKELLLPELGVRGFIDLVMVDDGVLYDIKTCNDWKWKTIFGKKYRDENAVKNYMLQTSTYGHWYQQHYHTDHPNLKSMKLLFYNKNNSQMREYDIPMSTIQEAVDYWTNIKSATEIGLPEIQVGFAPMYTWECSDKYCSFYEVCGGGIHNDKR